jgi:hypothetical protein
MPARAGRVVSWRPSTAYRFGHRRTRELLGAIEGLREDQVDAIAHDMALEWDRVMDGVIDAMSRAALIEAHALGERLTPRQAKQRIKALLGE